LKNDIRITRFGRFIRNTSLDELPQLWNVVRGEMSLVGPRPIVEAELQRYGKYASCYLMTKPGITGLWQVSGRSDIDYTSRVSLDVLYAMNQSFAGDVGILFKTIGVVLHGRGAY
jgi:lipopolysaccharide/colanic/teichoic acid biosynthesis glycosyltransferase